jgi:hypothetical protein
MDTDVNLRVSPDMIRWAAERVLVMHAAQPEADRATGRCAQCQRNGWCGMLHWARLTLAEGASLPVPASRHTA